MASWDSFAALGGKLSSSLLKPELDAHGKVDTKTTSLVFWQWFEAFRDFPESHGIPQNRIVDVKTLLDTFFPKPPAGQRVSVRRIASDDNSPDSYRRISPIAVSFGTNNSTILIGDAPNALGYIFSVAIPLPATSTGVQDYVVPLFVCYAWALHMAFWWPPSAETPVITNVPDQACLMYLPRAAGQQSETPEFCFGATWSGGDPPDAVGAGMRDNDQDEMDRWRKQEMIDPLFAASPTHSEPTWSPYARKLTARRLNEYMLGKPNNNSKTTPFLDPLFIGVFKLPGMDKFGLSEYIKYVSDIAKIELMQPLAVSVEPDFLISHSKLSPLLMDMLYSVLDTMKRLEDAPKLFENVQKLIRFYVTPHILDPVSAQEIPLGPQVKQIVEPIATSLPLVLLPSIKKKLDSLTCHLENIHESADDRIRFIETLYFIKDTRSLGRSPEAFPLYVLFHSQKSPSSLSSTRGMKLFPRVLGQAILGGGFKDGFSPAKLDNMSFQTVDCQEVKDPVTAPPDAEGSILVRLAFGTDEEKLGSYSDDAKVVCPKTMALF